MLERTYQIGIGGIKWWNLKDQLKGIGLPSSKQHLGNQWLHYLKNGFHPNFTVIWVGSNDVDDLDRATRDAWFSEPDPKKQRPKVMDIMNEWFDLLNRSSLTS